MGGADSLSSRVERCFYSSRPGGLPGPPRRKEATEAARSWGPTRGPGPSGAGPAQALPLIGMLGVKHSFSRSPYFIAWFVYC
jgi:hypothetical protein